jgi:hypothetical protein
MINQAIKGKPQGQRSPWQNLLAPMLLASLGLHGLFLLMPVGSSGEAPIPPPDPEQDSVAITRVPPAGTADPEATPPGAPAAIPPPVQSAVPQVQTTAPRTRQTALPRRSQPSRPARTASRPSTDRPTSARPQPSAPAASSAPATPPAPTAPPTPPSRPLFSAELGEQLLAYIAALDLPPSQVEQAAQSIQNRFAFNADAVTREALNANQQRWEAAIRQDTGLAELSPEIDRTDFSTVYPQRVCLSDAPGPITIGALVNPDGSWRGDPTLLRSSGYGSLDRKALQEIQSHTFAPAEGATAYVLTVETSVDYGPHPCLDPNPDT